MKRLLAVSLLIFFAAELRADEEQAWEKLNDESAKLTADLPEDEAAGRKILGKRLQTQLANFQKFLADFPQSPNRWEARMAILQIENSSASLEDREPEISGQKNELQSIADDSAAPANIRADAGLVLLQISSMDFTRQRSEESARALHAAIDKFISTHPDDARAPILRLTQAQALEVYDPEQAAKLYREFTAGDDPDLVAAARSSLEAMELRTKPLELSFTATDGRKIDMTELRGKVVLIDFWATWCPPCVAEAPQLVETYKKYHERGLEIIGISLDQNREALEKFTKENGMTWPQFFDGKGWNNEFAQRFNIQSVPTMWLFGRDGKLKDASARGERLNSLIENALDAE
jgi:thiol-disulfide isomerase/thioredoxin